MTTRLRWHCVHVLVAGVIACTMADAQTVDLRCVADGGVALCTEPTHVADPPGAAVDAHMWNYNVCDMAGTFLWREAAWTKVRDGKPIFDPDIVPVSTAFEQIVHNACQIAVTDTGWGQTIPSNILCWTGAPLVRNGSLIRDFRKLSFTGLTPSSTGCNQAWTEVVYAGKWRDIACPRTYNRRTKANGDLECWKLPPECTERASVGNPITLLDGCKSQREVDYRSRTPGGLEVERHYNSGGYFRFDVAAETAGDVWRTTWDRRILVPPVAGNVLAYAQRADGSLQAFGPAGRELQNNQGGASALLQRLTDATGAATGWRLTTANSDVETYDAAGRLLSIALRTGPTYTLAYTASGRLAAVTDAFGGSLTFTYDASGRLGGFVAPGNRVYVYGYDAAGRFTSVTYPDHTVRTYHYENIGFPHALTGITDENGSRFATWGYDGSGRAISSQHAGGAEAVTLYYGSYSSTANEGMTGVTRRVRDRPDLLLSGRWRRGAHQARDRYRRERHRFLRCQRQRRVPQRRQPESDDLRLRSCAQPGNLAHGSVRNRAGPHDHDAVASRVAAAGEDRRAVRRRRRQRGDGLRLRRAGKSAAEDDKRRWQDTAMEHDLQRARPGADGRRAADRRERRHDSIRITTQRILAAGAAAT